MWRQRHRSHNLNATIIHLPDWQLVLFSKKYIIDLKIVGIGTHLQGYVLPGACNKSLVVLD